MPSHHLNMHVQLHVSSGARCLNFRVSLPLLPYLKGLERLHLDTGLSEPYLFANAITGIKILCAGPKIC